MYPLLRIRATSRPIHLIDMTMASKAKDTTRTTSARPCSAVHVEEIDSSIFLSPPSRIQMAQSTGTQRFLHGKQAKQSAERMRSSWNKPEQAAKGRDRSLSHRLQPSFGPSVP
ncbi:hypothetical protein ONS95_014050 [Cadophora gregata]|uniref:uncharacterized protein n=1 Tax=Cadophora gregata TaxID=51156 RepID=UPI0026DCE99B|nr:uncharacterized protein ONS95_014050 [Cadophora gregata]KAK0113800.1 hypothetical protein ONS96_014655 [Cadophora gregata f. sp. sojae]KAK0114560.1 hypothetical protein ONS95_014050 [Cadophora gregata]